MLSEYGKAREEFRRMKEVAFGLDPGAKYNSPEDHDKKWHQFGVLGHIQKATEAAIKIKIAVGVDVVKEAVWHDIGKFISNKSQNFKAFYTLKLHELNSF